MDAIIEVRPPCTSKPAVYASVCKSISENAADHYRHAEIAQFHRGERESGGSCRHGERRTLASVGTAKEHHRLRRRKTLFATVMQAFARMRPMVSLTTR